MGCLAVVGTVMNWAKQNGHDKAEIIWIFEKGDQDQSDLRKHWNIAYPDGAVEPIFLKKADRCPGQDICKRIRPFEAADFIAYENLKAHKLLDKSDDDLYLDQLRRPMQRMKESLAGADKWAFFGAERIGRICCNWEIPARRS